MNIITNILFFSAAFFAVFVSADLSKYPLLDAKGIVGTRDCGTKNDLIKIVSLNIEGCDQAPCLFNTSKPMTLSVEFIPCKSKPGCNHLFNKTVGFHDENIASLSNSVTAIVSGNRVPISPQNTCEILTDGKCPLIKGQKYVEDIVLLSETSIPPSLQKVLKDAGHLDAVSEVVIANTEKTSSVCVTYPVKIV